MSNNQNFQTFPSLFSGSRKERLRKVRQQKERVHRLIRLCVLLVIVCFSLFFTLYFLKQTNNHPQQLVLPDITEHVSIQTPTPTMTPLGRLIKAELKDTSGTYAIVIKNFKTGETYNYNQNRSFLSASLYKLWVMGKTFEQITNGKLDENKQLRAKVQDLNKKFSIASESAELREGEISLPVNAAIKQMITISNNYAALLLVNELKAETIARYVDAIESTHSTVAVAGKPPTTTANDIALFFDKLYNNKLNDEKTTQKMIDLLVGQQLNSKIPKYLPVDIIPAHKTGELDSFSHDAGIIYTPQGDYILVILSETKSRENADEKIAEISRIVYKYFTRQHN